VGDFISAAKPFPTRSTGIMVTAADGYYIRSTGGPGFGDPLDREPERVAVDVARGYVSARQARDAYSVIVDETGVPDLAATNAARISERAARKTRPLTRKVRADGPPDALLQPGIGSARIVGEHLELDSSAVYRCRRCSHAFCNDTQNWKWFAAFREAVVSPASIKCDIRPRPSGELVFREYCCPGCGTQIETEVALAEEPPRWNYRPLAVWRHELEAQQPAAAGSAPAQSLLRKE